MSARNAAAHIVVAAVLMLAGCAGRDTAVPAQPRDQSQSQLFDVARGAFDAGEYRHAAQLYDRAYQHARLRDDVPAIADATYNLAVSRLRVGELEGAAIALGETRAALAQVPDSGKLDVLLLSAEVAYRRGDIDGARAWLAAARAAAGEAPRMAAQVALLGGQIDCDQGDGAAARQALADALAAAGLSAQARLEGCVALLDGDATGAAAHFDREASLQRDKRDYRAMSEALARAGDAYAKAGDAHAAADRLLRAGRSAVRQGALQYARHWLGSAQDFAATSGDAALREAAAADLRTLEQATAP